ncbi:spermatogenesis-associated protein 31D1-like [Apodemus sylvaticus]|uniref:spermatogenesis-associated protein 31D1-like n=1 Tax=Apodemus sylvaticus TaxID=10129 RepID=UPI0022444875|nr:spermatogenesis-associated protein 31D1-like [Apodemus sylvaticus]
MENILSSLSGLSETWLTLGSASYHIDLNHTLLSGLGLLLLYIWYLIWRLLVQTLRRKKNAPKVRKCGEFPRETLCGGTCQRDSEQRELQTSQQSSLEEASEATCNEPLLHRDPLFPVCDRSGDVGHQLSPAVLKDGAASHLCLASTAPGTKASFFPPSLLTGNQAGHPAPACPPEPLRLAQSVLSPNRFAALKGSYSSTPQSDLMTPASTLPSNPPFLPDPTPTYPLASFPLPTKEVQKSEVVFQPETTSSPVDGLNKMSTNVPPAKGTALPEASPQQSAADSPLSSNSEHSFNQHLPPHDVSQAPLQGDARADHLEPGYLFFPNSDALRLFQRLDKKGCDFLTAKEEQGEEDKGCFIKAPGSSDKMPSGETLVKPQDLMASRSASSEGKLTPQALPRFKTSEDHEELKPAQLFWGPPSLHSEALRPTSTTSYDRSSALVCFNSMAEASVADYSHAVMLPTPLSVCRPQTWPQTAPQSQSPLQRDPPAESQPQPQPQSPVSVLTLSSQSELRDCGVHFHRPQGDEPSLSPSAVQCLEYNILKKEQERVWGLPLVIQKSQDTFCPSPPKLLLGNRSSKACTPKAILPGDFPLTSELEKKLEHHLRKRLIQHRWGLPQRIDESLSLMSPQSELIDFSESRKNRGLSWITFFKYLGNRDSRATGTRGSGRSHSRTPESHSLQETGVKERTYSQDVGQNAHPQGKLQEASQNSLQSHSKPHQKSCAGRQPPKHSSPSQASQGQKGIENVLEKHLNKKVREISGGEIPVAVDRSRHSTNVANTPQPPPETSTRQRKDLGPLAHEEDRWTKHPHCLSLSHSQEKMLEEHITAFGRRMAFGLPQRVEESLESYLTKAEPSHPFPQQHVRAHCVPGADSDKPSKLLQRNTTGDRTGTVHSVPTQQRPLPATSPVGHSQPASENKKVCVDKDLSTAPRGREPPQRWTDSMADKGVLQQSGSDNRPGPELPMSPGGPTHESLASSTHTQGSQGERESWEDGSVAEGSTQRHEGEQLPGPHPQSTQIVKGTQGLCSPGSHVTASQSLQGMPVPHSSETPDSKSQVSTEVLANSEGGTHIQVPATPLAPEEMTSKPQGPSSGDMTVSQVLHVHLPTVGISMESPQGPWVPAYVSGKRKNKDCPPGSRALPPLATEAGKLGGGDAGLGTSQSRGKGHCVQPRASEETQGHTSSPALTPRSQPLENQLTSQVKGFWQRLSPGRKHKGQEKSLARGCSPLTSVKGTSLTKGRCELCGNTESQKCGREPGTVLRRQLGYRHGTVIPCPQAPVSPLGSEKAQQEVQLQAQTEPVQRLPHLCCKASCSQVQRAESCSPGQGQTAPEGCGTTGKAKRVESSPVHASPPKSYM